MNPRLSESIQAIWYGKRGLIAWLLWPLSLLYQLVCCVRRMLFRLRVLPSYTPSVPVIVIGNITVGGVGKTPFVAALADQLIKSGKRVGIVSRGYGGRFKAGAHWVTADANPAEFGDEPVMLARQLDAMVVVAAKRVQAIQLCEAKGCDVVLSDDGLSHFYFKRHSEYVLIDAARGFGNGFCLPAGPLREPISRLRTVTGVLKNTALADAPDTFCLKPLEFVCMQTAAVQPVDYFLAQTVHAVSAIGNNERFFNTLRELGCQVIEHPYPDHHQYDGSEWSFADDLPVIMTEKDSVKVIKSPLIKGWFLRIRADIQPATYQKINNSLINSENV